MNAFFRVQHEGHIYSEINSRLPHKTHHSKIIAAKALTETLRDIKGMIENGQTTQGPFKIMGFTVFGTPDKKFVDNFQNRFSVEEMTVAW